MSDEISFGDKTNLTLEDLACHDPCLPDTPRIMTLLREKKLNPEDVPEELLYFTDKSGMSVLDVCIERFREPVRNENNEIVPRVFSLVDMESCKLPLYFRGVKEILAIARDDGVIAANSMVFWGSLPESMMTEDILKLTDVGCSVAYNAVVNDVLPDWAKRRKDILLLGNSRGNYVVHALARFARLPLEMMTEEILKLQNRDGCFVAFHAAWHNSFPDWAKKRKDILKLGDGKGDYVAHVLARRGELPVEMMTKDILKLKDSDGQTVLAALVLGRNLSQEILLLPWNKNTKVFKYLHSVQFRKQVPNEQDMKYVKKQITIFETHMKIKSIVVLSVVEHGCKDMER